MPMPYDAEPEEPQTDTGLLEFIDRRRMHQERQRRHRMLVGALAALAMLAVVLAVSNVILIRRLSTRPETTAAATASRPAPVASAPTTSDAEREPMTASPAPTAHPATTTTRRPTPAAEPAPPAASTSTRPAPATEPAPPAAATTTRPAPTAEPAPPAATATARTAPAAEPAPAAATTTLPPRGERRSAPVPVAAESPAAEGDSAQRTARWLVQTHGRVEAENRAEKVAEFYSGQERAFWRRVLLDVRREPER